MSVAIDDRVLAVAFDAVECSESGGVRTVELVSPLKTGMGQPRVLIARLRGDEVLSAHAFVPQVTIGDHDYDMLQLVAEEVDGAPKPDCRLERGDKLTLVCNETTILPWLGAGVRPRPSFKATFGCTQG